MNFKVGDLVESVYGPGVFEVTGFWMAYIETTSGLWKPEELCLANNEH